MTVAEKLNWTVTLENVQHIHIKEQPHIIRGQARKVLLAFHVTVFFLFLFLWYMD